MDLLIVGDQGDPFSTAVQSAFRAKGKQAHILSILEAAQLFSITISQGNIQITPDLPMILRPASASASQSDADKAFQHSEALSTLWAAAAACKSFVLNRPTPTGMFGTVSFSAVLTQHRARHAVDTQERLTSQLPVQLPVKLPVSAAMPGRTDPQAWFVQDMGSFDVATAGNKPRGTGPYRARNTYREGRYERVVVLLDHAWRSTQATLQGLDLEGQSIQLLRNLKLDFGVVTWNITADMAEATIAKIDPFPTLEQVSLVWSDLSESLYQEIFK